MFLVSPAIARTCHLVAASLGFFLISMQLSHAADCSCPTEPCHHSHPEGKEVMKNGNVLDSWFIDFETSALWKITNVTDLNYVVMPQVLSWRSRSVLRWDVADGDLIVRNRLSLLGEYFLEGAESYYFGFSGSPALEWWNAEQNFSLYFYAGGGAGFTDSTDIEGGQGQDFAFNWFVQTGARVRLREKLYLSGGLFFQHISNRNLSDRNPGLNSLGPTIGLSWEF